MTKQEFMNKVAEVTPKEKKIAVVSDTDYALVERVYTFHPAISETEGKRQIAELYVNFGMVLIMDMLPRAEVMAKKESELREARAALSRIQEEIEEIRRGGELQWRQQRLRQCGIAICTITTSWYWRRKEGSST